MCDCLEKNSGQCNRAAVLIPEFLPLMNQTKFCMQGCLFCLNVLVKTGRTVLGDSCFEV